jgi:hypothetical protein
LYFDISFYSCLLSVRSILKLLIINSWPFLMLLLLAFILFCYLSSNSISYKSNTQCVQMSSTYFYIALASAEDVAKSLDNRLQWAQQRGYKAFRLQPRYNLASFRATRLPRATLLLAGYSGLRTDHCPDFWPRPPYANFFMRYLLYRLIKL